MVLAPGRLADDLAVSPLEPPETHGEGDARKSRRGGRPAPFPDRNVVVNPNRQWCDLSSGSGKHFPVGIQDEVIFHLTADVLIASLGRDREIVGGPGLNPDVKIHRQRGRIKRRPEVGRSGRQRKSERRSRTFRHSSVMRGAPLLASFARSGNCDRSVIS